MLNDMMVCLLLTELYHDSLLHAGEVLGDTRNQQLHTKKEEADCSAPS